jgi:hypothetical protein
MRLNLKLDCLFCSAGLPPDPRHTQLGARGPVRLGKISEGVPPYSGAMLGVVTADEAGYRLQRYQLGIAEGPEEIPSGELFLLS